MALLSVKKLTNLIKKSYFCFKINQQIFIAMKNTVLFLIFGALLFAFPAQSQLLKLLQTNGDSIGLNRAAIWKAVESSSGTTVSVGTKAYYLTTDYDDFLALAGGEFKSYTYFAGSTTKTFALNRNAIMRAYKSGTNSTIWVSNGSTFSLDDAFHTLFGVSTVALTEFTTFDTTVYVVPDGAIALQITCVGAGGGGGSGRRGVTLTPRSGGSGGGGGGGAASTNGANSGAGGAGGNGYIRIVPIFN